MFYKVANLPIEKVCIFKNFSEANFSDFKRLVVCLKINPLGQVVRKPVNVNPGLNVNCSIIFSCLKMFLPLTFGVV